MRSKEKRGRSAATNSYENIKNSFEGKSADSAARILNKTNLDPALSKDLLRSAQSSHLLTSSAEETKKAMENLGKTGASGINSLKDALSGAASSFGSFLQTPAGIGVAIAAVTAGAIAIGSIAEQFTESFEEAVEKADKSAEAFNNTKASIASMNSELESTNARIKELKGKDILSTSEQEELSSLKSRKMHTEAQKNIKEKQSVYQQKIAARDAAHVLEKEQLSTAESLLLRTVKNNEVHTVNLLLSPLPLPNQFPKTLMP